MSATYRGWLTSYDYPPIPTRAFDWSATHPDFDGADDACDTRYVHAATYSELIAEVDHWYAENEPTLTDQRVRELIDAFADGGDFAIGSLIGSIKGIIERDDDSALDRVRETMRIWDDCANARKEKIS